MVYDISEIKVIRKKLGLTQAELARSAGVSQSLVAKIESGSIDPAYSNVMKIFGFLEGLKKEAELKAADVMHSPIISVGPNDEIRNAVLKMKKHGISQIPVLDSGRCIGFISETSILNNILEKNARIVEDIMEECPPIIDENASVEIVSEILRHVSLVIVSEKGRLKGIITRADVIGRIK